MAGQASELDRKAFIAGPTVLSELSLGVEDLGDPDIRALVIRREHPEFEEALTGGWREIDVGQGLMNPRLHLTMHEIVATQLWEDSPPEVWETARRLLEVGYDRHDDGRKQARRQAREGRRRNRRPRQTRGSLARRSGRCCVQPPIDGLETACYP